MIGRQFDGLVESDLVEVSHEESHYKLVGVPELQVVFFAHADFIYYWPLFLIFLNSVFPFLNVERDVLVLDVEVKLKGVLELVLELDDRVVLKADLDVYRGVKNYLRVVSIN